MDILNEEEAMFESPLVDSYLSSPATVSAYFLNDSHAKRITLEVYISLLLCLS